MARRPKIAVGIALEGNVLRIVQLERRRDKTIHLTAIRRASLIGDDELEPEGAERVRAAVGGGSRADANARASMDGDPFAATAEASIDSSGSEAGSTPLVSAILAGVDGFTLRHVAVNVPDTHVFYHHMVWKKKGNRKELLQQARAELDSGSGGLATESIDTVQGQGERVISAARVGGCPVAEGALAAEEFIGGKVGVVSAAPDEIALADLARRVAPPADEEAISAVIHIADDTTRVILMRGSTVLRVAPIIHEAVDSPALPRTLVSRVLLAQDEAGVGPVDRFLLTGAAEWIEAAQWLRADFPDIDVRYLDLGAIHVEEDANTEVVDRFAVALGLAWSLLEPPDEAAWIDLLPKEIRERNLRGLAWHGVAMSGVIALCAAVMAFTGLGLVRAEQAARIECESVDAQIADVQEAAMRAMALAEEADEMEGALEDLASLAGARKIWSDLVSTAASHFRQIGGCWITVVASTKDAGMDLHGMTVRRPRLAELANRMGDVVLRSASELRVRTRPVYRFELRSGKDVESEIEAARALAAAMAATAAGAPRLGPGSDSTSADEGSEPQLPPGSGPDGSTDI